jgi:hypothetical protein
MSNFREDSFSRAWKAWGITVGAIRRTGDLETEAHASFQPTHLSAPRYT